MSSDYRSYNPANSKYADVAVTRAGSVDPQRGVSNFYGSGRYSNYSHWYANSSQADAATANRISYLAPSSSRPSAYYWGQDTYYAVPIKGIFDNQSADGNGFYRFSNGSNIVSDIFTNGGYHSIYYNTNYFDSNLLALSNSGVVSKIEVTTNNQDNTNTPATPLLFQTRGGIGANNTATMVTDYARDSNWHANDRDTYIWYRPNFGSNVQIPENVETMGEWISNYAGGRSGSKRKKKVRI